MPMTGPPESAIVATLNRGRYNWSVKKNRRGVAD